MTKKYTKELYDKLPQEKKEKVMDAAIKEFAASGINGCNVRNIAKRIGISHGSLFHYFSSKDDMIHTIIQEGVKQQQNVFTKVLSQHDDFFWQLESVFRDSLEFARNNREIISIWLDLSQPCHERFTRHTLDMEKASIESIKEMVKKAQKNGSIKKNIDSDTIAYMIDSFLSNILKSDVSDIERMKFKVHYGNDIPSVSETVKKFMKFLKNVLQS